TAVSSQGVWAEKFWSATNRCPRRRGGLHSPPHPPLSPHYGTDPGVTALSTTPQSRRTADRAMSSPSALALPRASSGSARWRGVLPDESGLAEAAATRDRGTTCGEDGSGKECGETVGCCKVR